MDDPIKVIHKYKNNNERIQYHLNIYVGDIQDESCMRVLKKIKNLDLYTTLTSVTKNEYDLMTKIYGEFWYEKFFISHHIIFTKETVLATSIKARELRNIYDVKWYHRHFTKYQERVKIMTFNYETAVKEDRERKSVASMIKSQQVETDILIDYTTLSFGNAPVMTVPNEFDALEPVEPIEPEQSGGDNDLTLDKYGVEIDMTGGESDVFSESEIEITTEPEAEDTNVDFDFDIDNPDAEAQEFDKNIEESLQDFDFNELDTDKNIKTTTREIKTVISNEVYGKFKNTLEFDTTQDNLLFDENLKNVVEKNYVSHLYIFKDDTIKTIKNKICNGFKNNPKYGENAYIIPAYQYLWCEYRLVDKIGQVMIGSKWIVKNDIIQIDVEPNPVLRVYLELRRNLKYLRDNIKRQGRIKREEDDNNILLDYEDFMTNNEIFMVDIYNELGTNFEVNVEEFRNLVDVYLRIYFPKIRPDDLKSIIDFLDEKSPEIKKNAELSKLKLIFDNINNDLILENEIMRDVELVKKNNRPVYTKYFKENYVTQSFIRVYLLERGKKVELYRIFNNFLLNDDFPFIQFRPLEGKSTIRYNKKFINDPKRKDMVVKWFENSPLGISFKMRVREKSEEKYMSINLGENGRVDYKIVWKESDMYSIDDIDKTYKYIRTLIEKINTENEKFGVYFTVPKDDQFRFAFINTIQRIELPEKFTINHNDLSEFARCFYPYVSLVIDPRKRQSKLAQSKSQIDKKSEKSKFGTYLRYRRISKYENHSKIEHRIVFFMRNYEYDDQSLATEISKEFNITEENAYAEIRNVMEKFPVIKKSRKVLKKLENIPKYKPPGIGVDIQGKSRDKYKMRVDGSRNKDQLTRITTFMNILIYLYVEIYLYKRGNLQTLKERFKKLTKIAKRLNKVDEIAEPEKTAIRSIKQMTSVDKKRLSGKKEENAQWSRECQQSGSEKRRQPQQYLSVDDLIRAGYVRKLKLGELDFEHYERRVKVDADGNVDGNKKKREVTLRAVKLPLDEYGNFVYYTCGPEENGKHMHIGFLNKSKSFDGDSRPCCFIKDHLHSKNPEKKLAYLKNIGYQQTTNGISTAIGDQLYILQNSNKVQENRIAFLPKYLDIFFNGIFNNEKVIRNHYLVATKTGYYFKYGVRQDANRYLHAVASTLETSLDDLKNLMIRALQRDASQTMFISLNNGNIATQFGTIDKYTDYIQKNENLDYQLVNDLLSVPGVVDEFGINIFIFQRKVTIIRESLEKEKIRENYYITCQNSENLDYLTEPKRRNVIIIRENKNYFPIIRVVKSDENSRDITITTNYYYSADSDNIVAHILEYHNTNCNRDANLIVNPDSYQSRDMKTTVKILREAGVKDFLPKFQIIDARYKAKFLITNAGHIVPVARSGIVYNIPLTANIDKYVTDYHATKNYLQLIDTATKSRLYLQPVGVFFGERKERSYVVIAVMTASHQAVPIKQRLMTMDYIEKEKLKVHARPNDDVIDREIELGPESAVIDQRILKVSEKRYQFDAYELFRFHLSYYLNNTSTGLEYRAQIDTICQDITLDKDIRKLRVKKLLYEMTDTKLKKTFQDLIQRISPNTDLKTQPISNVESDYAFDKKWMHVVPNTRNIDYSKYIPKNNRELCYVNNDRQSCCENQHCFWSQNRNLCYFYLKQDDLIIFINKVAEELILNDFKSHEIMRRDNYFVSDIVSYNVFTERPGENIIISSNNLPEIMAEIFGKDSIPKIGKRHLKTDVTQTAEELNLQYPLRVVNKWYIQTIIENNNSYFRAFANCFYWNIHPFSDIPVRNLGYYSDYQTKTSNFYKSQFIDWIVDPANQSEVSGLISESKPEKIRQYAVKIRNTVTTQTNGLIEFYVLSRLNRVIVCIYDYNFNCIFVMHPVKGLIYEATPDSKISDSIYNMIIKRKGKIINIRFIYGQDSVTPERIEAMHPVEKIEK